jgi:hypothetical protein
VSDPINESSQHEKEDISHKLDSILRQLEEISYAFPAGPHKHREEHEAWMEAKKAEKDFYNSLKQEIMKKGVAGIIGLVLIIIGLAVTGLMAKFGVAIVAQ